MKKKVGKQHWKNCDAVPGKTDPKIKSIEKVSTWKKVYSYWDQQAPVTYARKSDT